MSSEEAKTASVAYVENLNGAGFTQQATAFICPFADCRVFAFHYWGKAKTASVDIGQSSYQGRFIQGADIRLGLCTACEREIVWVNGRMALPKPSDAPPRAVDMPVEITEEYDEAAAIVTESPRGAAALLRLAVQKLLPILGATSSNINDQIGELVGSGTITRQVSDALDTLRVIGNESVHPGTIMLNDDRATAMGLFTLLNYIIEKAISEPKHSREMFAKLPQGKRDGIEVRNAKALSSPKI